MYHNCRQKFLFQDIERVGCRVYHTFKEQLDPEGLLPQDIEEFLLQWKGDKCIQKSTDSGFLYMYEDTMLRYEQGSSFISSISEGRQDQLSILKKNGGVRKDSHTFQHGSGSRGNIQDVEN